MQLDDFGGAQRSQNHPTLVLPGQYVSPDDIERLKMFSYSWTTATAKIPGQLASALAILPGTSCSHCC